MEIPSFAFFNFIFFKDYGNQICITLYSLPSISSMLLLLLSHFSHVWLCVDHIDGSPPGSSVPGILQARTLKWLAISSSNSWKGKVKVKSLSRVRLLGTPWTEADQSPPSMGFFRREYWSGVPLPSPIYSTVVYNLIFFFKNIYLFIYLTAVLVVACRIFSYRLKILSGSMWDIVPWKEIKPRPLALGARNLSHWTTRGVPALLFLNSPLWVLLLYLYSLPVSDCEASHSGIWYLFFCDWRYGQRISVIGTTSRALILLSSFLLGNETEFSTIPRAWSTHHPALVITEGTTLPQWPLPIAHTEPIWVRHCSPAFTWNFKKLRYNWHITVLVSVVPHDSTYVYVVKTITTINLVNIHHYT